MVFRNVMQLQRMSRQPHRNTLLSNFFDPRSLIRLVNFKNLVA